MPSIPPEPIPGQIGPMPSAGSADDPHQAAERRPGVPLAAMFLLIATIAVVMAMVLSAGHRGTFDPAYRDGRKQVPDGLRAVDPDQVDGSTFVFAFAGLATGAVLGRRVGGSSLFRLRGLFIGGVIGLMLGGATGFLIVCPPSLSVVLGGSLLLVATGLIGRWAVR